ncbi:alpha/beta fold hydrolase [Paenibacillus sp. R14(2021)]|uniref:alpha/beta fold hydrolase n=1 Tax=Paenibacillus sp. R14(2021) TaxID=2859228 RepID=UPI001C61435B|nr:alpha/beta hydrolase [Paenibacillus sp. R14(2021)]
MGYYITVEQGVKIFVEDINPEGKKTILFIHGWPLSHKQFEYQYNVLPSMGFRCIGMDWRGFGNSDKPYTGYTLDRLADDVCAVIGALQLENITLAGHSTGGAIAIRYMSRYRGYGVSKLVLIDAAAPTGFTPETASLLLGESLNDRPNMWNRVMDSFFFQYVSPPFRDWFQQIGNQAAGYSTAAIIKMLRDENTYADLPKIEVPTLIVHGIHDKSIPFTQAQEMNKLIKNSTLVPFQYSGHATFWEERDRFNQVLTQFIG